MHRQAIYLIVVIAAASAMLPFQNWSALQAIPHTHVIGLTSLVGLALMSELLSVRATVGTQQLPASVVFIPYFAAVLLFPTSAVVVALIATSVISQMFIHKRPVARGAFNTAQAAIAIIVASTVYESLGGVHTLGLTFDLVDIGLLMRLIVLASVFFFLNQLFVGIFIALSSEYRFSTIFNQMLAPSGAHFIYDVLVSPIALLVAVLYGSFGAGGLVIGILPVLIIRHSVHSMVRLQQANKDLLSVLVKTIETRDPYTSGHSIRVSLLARAIAEDMDLSATMIDRVETAALVHDIGKVDAIYASIIRKEGGLTDAERHVILTHAAKGADFLETLTSFSPDLIDGVRHHHERYDGTGYPDKLRGDEIPLVARIIQLCDSIDAMLSDRPYRKALSVEQVRSELVRCAGSQFDPRIVDIILRRNTLDRAAALVRPDSAKPVLVRVSA